MQVCLKHSNKMKIRGGQEEPPEACSQDKLVLIKRELQQIKKMMS